MLATSDTFDLLWPSILTTTLLLILLLILFAATAYPAIQEMIGMWRQQRQRVQAAGRIVVCRSRPSPDRQKNPAVCITFVFDGKEYEAIGYSAPIEIAPFSCWSSLGNRPLPLLIAYPPALPLLADVQILTREVSQVLNAWVKAHGGWAHASRVPIDEPDAPQVAS